MIMINIFKRHWAEHESKRRCIRVTMLNSSTHSLWTSYTVLFLFCVTFQYCDCIDSVDNHFPSQYSSLSASEKPKQFVIDQERGLLIVRGKGGVYKLNDMFEKVKNVSSSLSLANENNDYLMIIMPGSETLYICQYHGKCEVRNSTDLSLIFSEPKSVFFCQSGQKMKTFVGIASDLKRYSGLNPVFGGSDCGDKTSNIILAYTKSSFGYIDEYVIHLKNQVERTYPVYFRSVIQNSKFILFFTNQKISLESPWFTSKIIKICKESEEFKRVTYEDIPITCQRENKEYRLLQHATLLRVSKNDQLAAEMCQNKSNCAVIIGIFSSGNDPENPSMSSAVCVFTMDTILRTFKESRKRNLVGISNRFDGGYMTFLGTGLNFSEQGFDNNTNLNNREFCTLSRNLNLMSNVTLQGKALYENQTTRFTKIESLMTNGFAHVYIGTSDGKLLELHIKNKLEGRVIGNSVTVEHGKAVTKMGHMDRRIYAMTENKNAPSYNYKFQYVPTYVSSFCRCTQLEDLSDGYLRRYWLPAAEQKCVSLNLDKIGIPLQAGSVDVTITTYPPINITSFNGVTFKCMYDNLREKPVVANICNGIVGKQDHGQYWFYLLAVKEGFNVVVAKTLFWTYDCKKFDNCKGCVGNFDRQITCFWCKETAKCTQNQVNCVETTSTYVMAVAYCPVLIKSSLLRIPLNIAEDTNFPGRNIPALQSIEKFKCNFQGSNFSVSKVLPEGVTCQNLIARTPTQTPMKATETRNVIIYFQDGILDTTEIEVYDCKTLANDCSTCEYYRKIDNYLCSWCNHCQYSTKCPYNQECPAPKITNVFPENSTFGGNTEVILEGTNFGVNSSDVTRLSMAGIDCIEVIKRKNQFQKLWCKTGPSYKEHTGPVTITVNGKHDSYGQFSYKDQVLKAIKPNTIIKEGGVWLTISGTNLNVGNKKYVVFLNSTNDMEGILCENALLSMDNFITCSVDRYPSKFDRFEHQINLDKLIVMFDGNTTKELAMNFSYVSNPYDIRLSAIKSFSR
ncbi:hypothetical protein KUTeg_020354 [Tegillarca granosa]|uniref:Sema domain-containing protein n=1 Tax=Tegillarca granosa TaxID=220873 RepID=A0ABQ9EBV1_TEGGR|nr:hypothetical protein KUTeg_020354 [Tegillarca granosa]